MLSKNNNLKTQLTTNENEISKDDPIHLLKSNLNVTLS